MPYPTTTTPTDVVNKVIREFSGNPDFQNAKIDNPDWQSWINEILDDLYLSGAEQFDEFSITTVANSWSYPIDGTAGNLPAEIAQILRVEYDGAIIYPQIYHEEVISPTASSAAGVPDNYTERWDGGKRYLELSCPASSAVTLKVYATRLATTIDSTNLATAGALPVERDYYRIIFFMLMEIVNRRLASGAKDDAKCQRYNGEELKWRAKWINPAKLQIQIHKSERSGRQFREAPFFAPGDIYE